MSAAMSEVIDDAQWDDLRREVAELEQCLVNLTACMQRERECVTVFDLAGLGETVAEKNQLLRLLEAGDTKRTATFEDAWAASGAAGEMPGDVPAVLARMAEAPACEGVRGWLESSASELLALMDVVSELQNLNRAMVGRALQWVNAYVSELSGGTGTYNAKGRVVNRTRGTLVRSI